MAGWITALAGWPAVALISLVATALCWRTQAWRPVFAGLSSWQAGITLAFFQHLQWGPQMLFTFGPYGFVEDVLPFNRLGAGLGLIYGLAVRWGLAALVVSALRRSWRLLPAGVAAWAGLAIAANLVEAPELALGLALGLALACFRVGGSQNRRLVLLGALGALAGFQLLVEINVGLVSTGLAVLAVLSAARAGEQSKALGATALAFVVTPLVALLAAGQSLGNVPSYLRGSLSIAIGYGSAMSLSSGRQAEDWYAVVDVGLLAAIFALSLRRRPGVEKLAISLGLLGWTWEALKEGFVRHDLHDLTFFGLVMVALCLARLPRSLAPVQAAAIGIAAVLACVANGGPPLTLRSPAEAAQAVVQDVRDVASPGRWAEVESTARKQVRSSGDALPPSLLASLRGRSLAVEPVEDAMTFAYPQLRWAPEPVLQAYSAYTSYLDDLDAHFLASPRAPQRILYRQASISDQGPAWEPPATVLAMYCHYVELSESDHWLVLARVADRCGRPQLLGQVTAHFEQAVPVPRAPGQIVAATFSLTTPVVDVLKGILLKAPAVRIAGWGGGHGGYRLIYRFITGTAADSHVLVAPASLGYVVAPGTLSRLELSGGGWPAGQGTVHISFYSVPVSPK